LLVDLGDLFIELRNAIVDVFFVSFFLLVHAFANFRRIGINFFGCLATFAAVGNSSAATAAPTKSTSAAESASASASEATLLTSEAIAETTGELIVPKPTAAATKASVGMLSVR